MIRHRFSYWVIGLAVGTWIGSHATGRPVTLLDWAVVVALGTLTVLALLLGFERQETDQ